LCFGIFANQAWTTLKYVQVGGPIYGDIIQGKDLVADILPPPLYIVEAHLLVHEIRNATDESAIREHIARGNELRHEYEERYRFWSKHLPEGELKNTLLFKAHEPAMKFLQLRDQEFIPAKLAGKQEDMHAVHLRMAAVYRDHRSAIDQVVA
jgi:hypothetical protein